MNDDEFVGFLRALVEPMPPRVEFCTGPVHWGQTLTGLETLCPYYDDCPAWHDEEACHPGFWCRRAESRRCWGLGGVGIREEGPFKISIPAATRGLTDAEILALVLKWAVQKASDVPR